MQGLPNVASVASLMGDPTRAAMLITLMDGRPRAANELGYAAGGITAQSASGHLAKLLDGGLLTVMPQGRHRYYSIASEEVAHAVEALSNLAIHRPRPIPPPRVAEEMRYARSCYDHLAGVAGTALTQALCERGFLRILADRSVQVTDWTWWQRMGIDRADIKPAARYGLGRVCLDWTERRHHLAGPLGRRLLETMFELRWFSRVKNSRVLRLTPAGAAELESQLGCSLPVQRGDGTRSSSGK